MFSLPMTITPGVAANEQINSIAWLMLMAQPAPGHQGSHVPRNVLVGTIDYNGQGLSAALPVRRGLSRSSARRPAAPARLFHGSCGALPATAAGHRRIFALRRASR